QIEGRTFDLVLRSADGRPEGVHRRPAEWVAHTRCATDCVAHSCARPASLQNQTTMLGQMVTSGHFSDENEVGRSMELLISARIGPSRSLAERRDIHSFHVQQATPKPACSTCRGIPCRLQLSRTQLGGYRAVP